MVAVGSFLFAAFLVPPQANGVLDAAGYRALRLGTAASGVWTVCAALLVPLTVSDVSGQPLRDHLNPVDIWSAASLVDIAGAWRWTAFLAAAVTLASLPVLRWSWTPLLLAGALITLVPLGLTGHSSAGGAHDLATNSLLIHLGAGALWAGGLLALLAHVPAGGRARRSGRPSVLGAGLLVLCGYGGQRGGQCAGAYPAARPGRTDVRLADHRQAGRAVPARRRRLAAAPQRYRRAAGRPGRPRAADPAGAGRVGGVRATFGIAVALGRTPPPPLPIQPVDPGGRDRLRLRGAAHGGAGAVRLALRPDLRHRRDRHVRCVYLAGWPAAAPRRRVACRPDAGVVVGCPVLLFATSSGLGRYMPAMFSMHMVAHMLLSMLVPILLVLGAPVTLALRALTRRGPRRTARTAGVAAGRAALAGLAVPHQPVRRDRLFVGGLLRAVLRRDLRRRGDNHAAHVVMNLHFLLTGYLFYWVVIGVDPTPRPIPPLGKVAMVFASLPFHAFFGVVLMSMQTVLGEPFYRSLQLYWHTDLLGDQRLGGGIAWAAGEVPLVVVMIALLIQWRRSDQRTAKRLDRAADRDDDADLAAYNAMLAELARREDR